ncbi:30S ribosomal protein S6e [Candidatus Woesearchaeota archaeon]|nr:MAG: 30S ribosomal protein S6e [Candidatus Woesearchaeota archaeon]
MTSFKIVIGTKTGKCLQKELTEEESSKLIGKKIGETIKGDDIGFAGYEFLITGGSDHCGFPMRADIDGSSRKKIFAVKGVGLKKKGKGIKVRKTVCGNTIYEKTAQINFKVLKEGKAPLFEESKPEEKSQEAEKKETSEEKKSPEKTGNKAEEPQETKTEEMPAEENKQETEKKPAEKTEEKTAEKEKPKE